MLNKLESHLEFQDLTLFFFSSSNGFQPQKLIKTFTLETSHNHRTKKGILQHQD